MTKLEARALKPKKKLEEDGDKDTPKKKEKTTAGIFEMFRFASRVDKVYIFLAVICSILNGLSFPIGSVIFSKTVDSFMDSIRMGEFLDHHRHFLRDNNLSREDVLEDPTVFSGKCEILDELHNTTGSCGFIEFDDPLSDDLKDYVYCFIGSAILIFFASLGQNTFWTVSAERQGNRIRRAFLTNILRQNIGWFDARNVGELNAQLSADISRIQNGIGENVGTTIQFLSSFFFGYLLGFIFGWQLALIMVAFSPLMICAGGFFNYMVVRITAQETTAYSKAGAIAEEILSSIRTVVAYSGEEKGRERYENNLGEAHKRGLQKGAATGAVIGFYGGINFTMYAIGMWFAGKFVRHDDLDIDEALVGFFAVSLGTFSLGIAGPGIQAIAEARGAAFNVFQIIDTKSDIDSSSDKGLKLPSIRGKIQFRDVHFSYPTRMDAKILNGANIEVRPGQTVAIVGASGCGKSTLIQLLLRFYDPQGGQVLLDGMDIKKLNIKYLRQLIGLVSQEPVLFGTTIAENIRYGRDGVTTEEINQAAKNANAYDFISEMPDKFNTIVGERGAQLSGGQKQRIAIARTLVRDPKILLLDEATSALDNESEAIVQDALDMARQGRTTIIVAHRLSTIRTADIIIGLEQGVVKESGTHDELMAKRGIYYTLVTNQTKALEEEELSDEEEVKNEEKIDRKRIMSIGDIGDDIPEIDEELPMVGFAKLLRVNLPEWPFLFLGCVAAIVHGATQPAFAFVFGRIMKVFSEEDEEMKDDMEDYCLVLLIIAGATFIAAFLQSYMLAIAGEAMTERLRAQTFRAMLRQEIGWYDKPYNSTGALSNRLAKDTCLVQGATGTKLGVLVQCFIAIAGAIVLAFVYGWQLTLMAVCLFPFLLGGGIMQVKLLSGNVGLAKEASESAAKVAVEVLENVRTVASLSKEQHFIEKYMHSFEILAESMHKRSLAFGFFFALSNASVHVTAAVIFAYGGYLVDHDDMDAQDVLKVFTFLTFCGVYLGQSAGFSPDIGKATAAARRIFYVLQRKSRINAELTIGSKPNKATFKSTIEFSNTTFSYPLRPEVKVLNGFNLAVKPGQTVALVGSSGCGKSTCIALLERFYNIDAGTVSVGNKNLEDLNIRWLRYQIGLVSQEPVLFDCSIAENIAYGDNSRLVTMDEIVRAAQKANIHNFVTALPQGYETNVGDKGTQLSGGQKQRIAIARALLRDPKILLLDEATSALDTESEAIVQEALDKAREGRTCITIAHRLSTIRDAHKIVVLKHGQMIEAGTHEELMARKGAYYRLQNAQSKG